MIILATFFPTYEVPQGKIDLHGELMKGAVELFDLIGLFVIISQQIGRGDLKILVAGVGMYCLTFILYLALFSCELQ